MIDTDPDPVDELIETAIRDAAVRSVDAVAGYTCEAAPSPAAHREAYDLTEAMIAEELRPVVDLIAWARAIEDAAVEQLGSTAAAMMLGVPVGPSVVGIQRAIHMLQPPPLCPNCEGTKDDPQWMPASWDDLANGGAGPDYCDDRFHRVD